MDTNETNKEVVGHEYLADVKAVNRQDALIVETATRQDALTAEAMANLNPNPNPGDSAGQ